MQELESQLQLAQKRSDMEAELQSLRFDQEQMSALVKVNEDLKQQVDEMQQETKMAITEQKQKMKRLGSDLSTAQKEMKAKHKAYENAPQEARGFRGRSSCLEEPTKKLELEAKGKTHGLGQSTTSREHNRILEVALAKREADLVQLNLQVQAVLRSKEEEDQKMKQLIQTLQMALEKEKANVLTLKEQVRSWLKAFRARLRTSWAEDGKHSEEVSQIQRELVDARSQLQLLQKQLDDQLDKQPVENQELEDLKWEVEQKERELQALKQQLDLTEQRSQKELEGVQLVLQKDKFMLQAKMSELKNSIKTLLQQNQQLKLDLKQGKMKKRQMEEHTVTVHESMSSWTQIEGQLTDLTTNLSVTLLANESLPHRDLQDHKPSTDVQEEVTQ
ncbi:putative Golgin A3 protein [Naja naja]|nr:putative Golgin A3 protein [Naja naja]